MNLATRGIEADFCPEHADTFRRPRPPRADRRRPPEDRPHLPRLAGEETGANGSGSLYADLAGYCRSATTAEIAAHGHVLTPVRYVGAEEVKDDGEPFEEKMTRLLAELHRQFAESAKLETAIKANLEGLGVMASEETVRLRDVCVKIGSGATPRGGKEAYKGGVTSLIRSQNIYNEGFHRDWLVYIDDDHSADRLLPSSISAPGARGDGHGPPHDLCLKFIACAPPSALTQNIF